MKRFKKSKWIWVFPLLFVLSLVEFLILPPKGYIPVLMYHFIVPKPLAGSTSLLMDVKKFRAQMWFLKTFGFRPISLDEFYAIKTGQLKAQGREVVLTFDDGDRSYIESVLPVLEHYQFPSVSFVVWDYMEKKMFKSINLDELEQISKNPLVTIGSHTLTHRNLRLISIEEAHSEIFDSKKKLEEFLNKPVYYFCYPEASFNEEVAQLVQQAGYRLSFRSSVKRFPTYPSGFYAIQRIKIHSHDNLLVFWFHVSGISTFTRKTGLIFRQLTGNKANGTLNHYEPTHNSV